MTLRMAITDSNLAGGSNRIAFAIPAETAAEAQEFRSPASTL